MPNLSVLNTQSLVPESPTAAGNGAGANGVVGAGLGLLSVGANLFERHEAIAKKQQLDEAQVGIVNALSQEHMTSLQAATDAANSGQMPGFVNQWQKDFDQRAAAGAQSIPQIARAHYDAQMADLRGQLGARFYAMEMGARNVKLKQDSASGIDTDASTAFIDRTQAADLLARRRATIASLELPDEEKAQLNTLASQKISYAAGSAWATSDPDGFLKSLGVGAKDPATAEQARQADPVLSQLAPQNLEALVGHAQTQIARRDAANAAAKDQAEAAAVKTYNGLLDFVAGGQVPSLDYAAEVTQGTKGTAFEQLAQDQLKRAYTGAGFGSQSLPRQQALLSAYEARGNTVGSDPETERALAQMRTIHQTQTKAYADNPWEASARFAHLPVQPEQQITTPEQGLAVIAARRPLMSAVENASGATAMRSGVSPLQPGEASAWAASLSALSVRQRADVLGRAGAGMEPAQINALADQIGHSDPVTALMLKTNDRTAFGRSVAELIGRGAQAVADKVVKVDDSAVLGWRAEIAGYLRGALVSAQTEDDAIQAAFYVRAAASADASLKLAESSADAVALVVGRPITRGGVPTVLPRGMLESDFDAKLRAFTPELLKAQAPDGKVYLRDQGGVREIPLLNLHNRLVDFGMKYYAPGVYAPVRNNTIVTTDKEGTKPLLLKVQ